MNNFNILNINNVIDINDKLSIEFNKENIEISKNKNINYDLDNFNNIYDNIDILDKKLSIIDFGTCEVGKLTGGGGRALSDAEFALKKQKELLKQQQEYVRILEEAVKKDNDLSLKKQSRMKSIFKRLITFFPFIDYKSEKCFYDFYNLNEVRYRGEEDWSDRNYILNGSFFIQYAIKFGTPGKMLQMKSDKKTDEPKPVPTKISSENENGVGEKMDTTTGSLTPDRDHMKKKEDDGPNKNAKENAWQDVLTKAKKKEKLKQEAARS